MRSARVGASLKGSARLFAKRSLPSLALGAGIVLGLISVCCGSGVLMTPWLLCELNALQLAQALGRPMVRNRSWVGAGLILLAAVLLVASVGWLTWLGVATATGTPGSAAVFALGSALVTLAFVLPFLYAPLILVEGRSGLGGAALESARLVMAGGGLSHLLLSLAANAVQIAPLLIAAGSAAVAGTVDQAPVWMLASLPLLSLTVPLGQGMLVSAYIECRDEIADPRRARLAGRPPIAVVVVWAVIVSVPLLSFVLMGMSLLRPSRLPAGHLPAGAESIAQFAPLEGRHSVYPPGTALEIMLAPEAVRVIASDGGGAGRLPLRSGAPVEEARVARLRDSYVIEIVQAGEAQVTSIDRAGVRLDDDFGARLLDRVPNHALRLMLASLLLTACTLLPVLASLGEVRRVYTLEPGTRPPARAVSQQRDRTIRRALLIAVLLAPLSALSLYWGVRSILH